ncbi:MAG: apolipoprotein N-acyltransferase [Succinivibrio sp.]|nr:apolipoprotein N-acyltransferase [Succinivibrio sp.]
MLLKFVQVLLVLLDLRTLRALVLSRPGTLLSSLLLGLLSTLGFAPYNFWTVLLCTLSLELTLASAQPGSKRVFLSVLVFFTGFFLISHSWLQYTMGYYSGIPETLGYSLILLGSIYLALYYATSLSLLHRLLFKKSPAVFLICACPLAVLLCDYLIGIGPLALPWMYFGYACQAGPYLSFAPLIGVRGMTLLLLITAALIAMGLRRQFLYLPGAALIFLSGILLSNLQFVQKLPAHQALLVQGNIEQMVKWQSDGVDKSVETYLNLTTPRLGSVPLIILPESAIPLYFDLAQNLYADLNTLALSKHSEVIIGVPRRDGQQRPYQAYNSLYVLGSEAELNQAQIYDKRKLVPFGEYTPFAALLRPLSELFAIPMSSFVSPKDKPELLHADKVSFIPAICYEAIFPELLKEQAAHGAQALLMVSNDTWFGQTRGPEMLLAMSRLRALELQKPLLRASNNIHTLLLDHEGRLVKELPANQTGVLEISYEPTAGQTPYVRYGTLALWLLCALLALLGVFGLFKTKDDKAEQFKKLVRP